MTQPDIYLLGRGPGEEERATPPSSYRGATIPSCAARPIMEPLIAKANEEFLPIPGPPCERAMIAAPSGNDRYLREADGWSRR